MWCRTVLSFRSAYFLSLHHVIQHSKTEVTQAENQVVSPEGTQWLERWLDLQHCLKALCYTYDKFHLHAHWNSQCLIINSETKVQNTV